MPRRRYPLELRTSDLDRRGHVTHALHAGRLHLEQFADPDAPA